MISFIISGVVNKELYFLWNQFKMPEYALIYLCSDLLTTSFSTFFLTTKIGLYSIYYFWNLNRNSISFFIMYLKNLATTISYYHNVILSYISFIFLLVSALKLFYICFWRDWIRLKKKICRQKAATESKPQRFWIICGIVP